MRVILITGANGGLGQAIGRAFLDESPENFVWLGVHKGQEHATRLQDKVPERCRKVALDLPVEGDVELAADE